MDGLGDICSSFSRNRVGKSANKRKFQNSHQDRFRYCEELGELDTNKSREYTKIDLN